jgi:hypothetical protein
MKKLMIALGVLAMLSTKAQISFLEASQHTISPNSMGVVNGFQWNDTTYLALYDAYYGLGTRTMHIIEYDEFGKRRKEIKPNYHYGGAIPKKLSKIGDSKIYLLGSGDDSLGRFTTFNYMYDENWNVLWSKGYDFRYQDLTELNDSIGVASVQIRNFRTGIASINLNTGDTLWTRSYNQTVGLHDSLSSGLNFVNQTADKQFIYSLFQNNTNLNIISIMKHDGTYLRNDTIRSPVFDQRIYGLNGGYLFLSLYSNSHKVDVLYVENSILHIMDSIRSNDVISLNNIVFYDKNYTYLCLKYWIGSGFINNICEVRTYHKLKNLLRTIQYKVIDFDLNLNLASVGISGSPFFTGNTSYLNPENRSFIMKTDSNGFVSNPTLFTLVVDTSMNDTNVSTQELNSLTTFAFYPNPAQTIVTISGPEHGSMNYTMTNTSGQIVTSGAFEASTQINVSNLSNGLYFLHLKGESILETRKIVVQR